MQTTHRQVLILGAVLLLVGLAFLLYRSRDRVVQRAALYHREVAAHVLADYVAAQLPGQPVLVIANPFTQSKGRDAMIYGYEKAAIQGLRKGFGSKTPWNIAFPELRPEAQTRPGSVHVDPRSTTPLSYLVAEGAFDRLARKHAKCNGIVSLIGLPVNATRLEVWRTADERRFALLLPDWRTLGDRQTVVSAFKTGKLLAAVLNKPGAPPEDTPLREDYRAEFEKRFLLVTVDNVEQLMADHPRLFP